jgi:hypothetical protein
MATKGRLTKGRLTKDRLTTPFFTNKNIYYIVSIL